MWLTLKYLSLGHTYTMVYQVLKDHVTDLDKTFVNQILFFRWQSILSAILSSLKVEQLAQVQHYLQCTSWYALDWHSTREQYMHIHHLNTHTLKVIQNWVSNTISQEKGSLNHHVFKHSSMATEYMLKVYWPCLSLECTNTKQAYRHSRKRKMLAFSALATKHWSYRH